MNPPKYAIVSVNPVIHDFDGQLGIIRRAIEDARKKECSLVVFPELSVGSPNAGDLFLRRDFIAESEKTLARISPLTRGITVVLGAPLYHEDHLYNVAAIFHDGALLAFVPKRYSQDFTPENRWFDRWDFSATGQHLGASIGAFHGCLPGLENLQVCCGSIENEPSLNHDAILVEVSCRSFTPGDYRESLTQCLEISRIHALTLISTNILGSDDGTHIYDGGGYILSHGNIFALAPRFTFNQDYVLTTSEDAPSQDFDPTLSQFKAAGTCPDKEEDYIFSELELALCLGLNDYLKKAHISRLCLALSGGRDSAMIAVLAGRLTELTNPHKSVEEKRALMRDFLITAYLPNENSSSSGTQKAAEALAEFYGFNCPVIPISGIASSTVSIVENGLGRKLSWETDDLTLQNVQARTRSSIIWTLANARDALLLTTGNMSEAAVGYATMDGDSSGCLDPIGNIPKTMVSAWLEWARKFHNITALDLVFEQPPSAELRPLEKNQRDEADLMPYPVLDAYIDWCLIQHLSLKECFQRAKSTFAGHYGSDDEIRRDLNRFVALATRSQWKRCRFANSFSVLADNLSPGDGLQWPCLQNGFRIE